MLLGCMLLGVLTSRDGDKNSSLCRFMFLIPSDPEKKKKETICREDETAV